MNHYTHAQTIISSGTKAHPYWVRWIAFVGLALVVIRLAIASALAQSCATECDNGTGNATFGSTRDVGTGNTAVGIGALVTNTGSANTATGEFADLAARACGPEKLRTLIACHCSGAL